MFIGPLIKQIASIRGSWQIAAFAIAGILVLVQVVLGSRSHGGKRSGLGTLLVLLAILIAVIGLSPIFADAYLKAHSSEILAVYHVRVIVLNPQGVPVKGAVLRSAALNDTSTNDQGIADLTIPRATLPAGGKITLYADLDAAHAQQDIQLSDDPNLTTKIELKLARDAVVSGLVEDDNRHAISGAVVTVVGGETGMTQADGSFKLKANAADGQEIRLHIEKTGYQAVDQDHPAGRGQAIVVLTRMGRKTKH